MSASLFRTGSPAASKDKHWISVSDLMAGLMVIFLLIAVVYISRIQSIFVDQVNVKKQIYEDLYEEFKDDLPGWNAELIEKDLSIHFIKAPRVVLFAAGDATLQSEFKSVLNKFYPRYLKKLHPHRHNIAEVRIEGHTSSEWRGLSGDRAYFENMRLSQDRTRSVLQYGYFLPQAKEHREWSRKIITANGLSSSRPIKLDGKEDKTKSRRVEFRILTNSETPDEILGKEFK